MKMPKTIPFAFLLSSSCCCCREEKITHVLGVAVGGKILDVKEEKKVNSEG